jgi:DNA adenine methylase
MQQRLASSALPRQIERVGVPPIKCQGIKTKLVRFILSQIDWQPTCGARWIEPFLGSGVVVLNLLPDRALLTDSNQHIIRFYQAIQRGKINRTVVRDFLQQEGEMLTTVGADYYYQVRDRFNQFASPLDFLFLNRACFNGVMRFNSRGKFNVPFCRKPQRFSQAYISKIANQVDWVARQLADKQWEFRSTSWQETLAEAKPNDFVYMDPPYIGRHTHYSNAWNQKEAEALALATQTLPCGFAVSMWLENSHRRNTHIQECWSTMTIRTSPHFYHVGSKEAWRGTIAEALLIKPGFAVKNS